MAKTKVNATSVLLATDFIAFRNAVNEKFKSMQDKKLFRVAIDKDEIWNIYLSSFPDGSKTIYKERDENDCNTCKSFIRNAGDIVTIEDGKLVSIWDVEVADGYQQVANALSTYVKSKEIKSIFLHNENKIGNKENMGIGADGGMTKFHHFEINLPRKLVSKDIGALVGNANGTRTAFLNSLEGISIETLDVALDAIKQGYVYRGNEYLEIIKAFKTIKLEYEASKNKVLFTWLKCDTVHASVAKIKNTAVGTFLENIEKGLDLEECVKKFCATMEGYKVPKSLNIVSAKQIDEAKKTIEEAGLMPSLQRRFAKIEDISINNVLFASNKTRKIIDNVFDEIASKKTKTYKTTESIQEMSIQDFIQNVLPQASEIEIKVEGKHIPNFVSLITESNKNSPQLFKWNNPFSWDYNGRAADSVIKQNVKSKGGSVTGCLRGSLSWFNYDDLDAYCKTPVGRIYFGDSQCSKTKGKLDVDMNRGGSSPSYAKSHPNEHSSNAVENIIFPDIDKMVKGKYVFGVNNYCKTQAFPDTKDGFTFEIEFDNQIHQFDYSKAVKSKENVDVVEVDYDPQTGFSYKPLIAIKDSKPISKDVWNLQTESFYPVSAISLSPNYWDENKTGNKHFFFFIEGCKNPDIAKPFYNEFLISDLDKHRKAMQIVSNKLSIEAPENQLSGLGFSDTKRDSITLKVTGAFNRIIKVNI